MEKKRGIAIGAGVLLVIAIGIVFALRDDATLTLLSLRTVPPGATVLVNGVSRGQTPVEVSGLKIETNYLLRIEKPGFKPLVREVRFKQDHSRATIDYPLEPEALVTNPTSAEPTASNAGALRTPVPKVTKLAPGATCDPAQLPARAFGCDKGVVAFLGPVANDVSVLKEIPEILRSMYRLPPGLEYVGFHFGAYTKYELFRDATGALYRATVVQEPPFDRDPQQKKTDSLAFAAPLEMSSSISREKRSESILWIFNSLTTGRNMDRQFGRAYVRASGGADITARKAISTLTVQGWPIDE